MIDLVHIWNDNRYRSKALFIISPTYAYDPKVKVTGLEILYLIPDHIKFMTTNDQTIAQELYQELKCHSISPYCNDPKYWDR